MADFNWDDAKTGAVTGGVAGATAGTMVMPGVGTAVGGAAGLIGGGLIGGFGGFGGGLWDTMSGQTDPSARYGHQGEPRKLMQQNEMQLQQSAQGNGPSAARDLLERNRSEGQQRALSNAKAMGGGNAALSAQLANRQQSQVSADAGLQTATIRAQEQQNAMQAYQAALQARRQQDIEIANKQAEIDQKNAENNSDFIGGLMSGAGGAIGGMF